MTKLENLMYKEYVSIEKSGTLEDVIKIMDQNHHGVVVVLESNIPVGILTERNILEVIRQDIDQSKSIVNIFTLRKPITINIKRSVDYALHILIDNAIRRLVVVDNVGSFKGVVTQDVLVKNLEENSFKTDILISQILDSNRKLITLSQDDTIANAFSNMSTYKVGSIIATDIQGEAVGILTEKDAVFIANKKVSTTQAISTVMSSPVITTKTTTPLRDVIQMMAQNKINRIIITQEDTNKPINILSMRDIAQSLKGNYGRLLEFKLKNIKNTLNLIDEYVIEVCEDNNTQVIQWMNSKAIEKFGNFLDTEIDMLIEKDKWNTLYRVISRDGKCYKDQIQIKDMYFNLNCSYHFTHKNETLLLVLQDITKLTNVIIDEKIKNQKLYEELQIVKSVIDHQNNIILVTDGKEISLTNKAFLDFFNVKTLTDFSDKFTNLESTFIAHQGFFSPNTKDTNWIKEIRKLHERDTIVSLIDYRSFEPKVFSIQLVELASDDTNFIVTFTDITEEKLESQKYYFNATHDALTKIYNKSFFLDSLYISLGKTKRYQSKFSLIFFNIDNLKLVNDDHGFLHGDTVVTEIAKIVDKSIRSCDIFARFSGEVFAIILPETIVGKAELLAENLRKTIENIKFDDIKQQTASFGLTQFSEIDNENTLLRRVEEALRVAKENGKNTIVTL